MRVSIVIAAIAPNRRFGERWFTSRETLESRTCARKIAAILTGAPKAPPPIDQILSTRQVMQITGKHRVTIYRWIRAGIFPKKHDAHGHKVGWLRSDVEARLQRDGSVAPAGNGKENGATQRGAAPK